MALYNGFSSISDPNDYEQVCADCQCGGLESIDWMLVSTNQYSVEKCFHNSKANIFCGTMIVIGGGNCYCRRVGREDSCSREAAPDSAWNVYIEPTGKPEYKTKEENYW